MINSQYLPSFCSDEPLCKEHCSYNAKIKKNLKYRFYFESTTLARKYVWAKTYFR